MRITLLTDFGDRDGFIGAMKGVIACRAPNVPVVDLAHHVPPGDVRHAAHVLYTTAPFFPAGTIHVVVVDPGVGTARRAVAVAVDEQIYVAPDNGVLTAVLAAAAGRVMGTVLDNPAFWQHPVSSTFHGRDVFAPAAAHLALGVPITALGSRLDPDTLCRLEPSPVARSSDGVRGEVTHIDIFGNAITNLGRQDLSGLGGDGRTLCIRLGETEIVEVADTYGSVEPGRPVAVIGGSGRLEIAVNGGSAAEQLGLQRGTTVTVSLR